MRSMRLADCSTILHGSAISSEVTTETVTHSRPASRVTQVWMFCTILAPNRTGAVCLKHKQGQRPGIRTPLELEERTWLSVIV